MICRAHRIIVVLLVLVLLIGCTHSDDLEMDYVIDYYPPTVTEENCENLKIDNTTPYEELITKTVDIHMFAQRYNPFGKRNISDVKEYVGIECLRNTDEGALYSVHKVKQGGLLYVFYDNYDWKKSLANKSIIRWFYVRERLSFSDFKALDKGIDTIDDAIAINKAEQIYLNIFRAAPAYWDKEVLYTTHYLEDGILEVGYKLIDGKLIFTDLYLTENFDCPDLDESKYYPYNARILDIDWLE